MRRDALERLLPSVYQLALHQARQHTARTGGASLLSGLLDVMASLHADTEQRLSEIEQTFHPRLCPEAFVPMLASWVALPVDLAHGVGRQRELIATAVSLGQRRGTYAALRDTLRYATGLGEITIEEGVDASGAVRSFHIVVRVPSAGGAQLPVLHQLIAAQKPAHLTYELCVAPEGSV